jgi:hypothetical protein
MLLQFQALSLTVKQDGARKSDSAVSVKSFFNFGEENITGESLASGN